MARWWAWAEGAAGLSDCSSAPKRIPHKTSPELVQEIVRLRRLRITAAQIATASRMALSTISAVLKRVGLGRRSRLQPPEPPNRYERRRPGELIHIDVKKLGRILKPGIALPATAADEPRLTAMARASVLAGWEFVHVAIDDHSRLPYAEVLTDEKGPTAVGFLKRALEFYGSYGIKVERVMTDNGFPYVSHIHAKACRELQLRHLRTRLYRPRTNGKACVLGWCCRPAGR
jgi:transposase InsO family protein